MGASPGGRGKLRPNMSNSSKKSTTPKTKHTTKAERIRLVEDSISEAVRYFGIDAGKELTSSK